MTKNIFTQLLTGLQPHGIRIKEIKVDEIGEPRHWTDGVIEDGGEGAPDLKLVPKHGPTQDTPGGMHQAEP